MAKNKVLIIVVIAIASCSLIFAISKETTTADRTLIVRLEKENWISKLDITTKQSKQIYHSDKYWVHSLTVSPNNKYIAFIEETKPEYGRSVYEVPPQYNLMVIDDSGKIVSRVVEDVKKYAWSPDGQKIAFLTFAPRDPDYEFKYPTGVWIFDITSQEKKKIAEKGRKINWATHDSNVYFTNYSKDGNIIQRWNSINDRVEITNYKGIYFSPDGKYYLGFSAEDFLLHPYVSSTNQEITERVKSKLGYLPQSWIPDQQHHMLAVKIDYEPTPEDTIKSQKPRAMVMTESKIKQKQFFIYDVEKDQIIKEWIEKPGK